MFHRLCTSIHQHIEPTVVCAELVTYIAVLLFIPKGSHFAAIHTAYMERQRNVTAHHYRQLFFFSARPPVHFGDQELTGNKEKTGFPLSARINNTRTYAHVHAHVMNVRAYTHATFKRLLTHTHEARAGHVCECVHTRVAVYFLRTR